MKKTKKLLLTVLSILTAGFCTLGVAGCTDDSVSVSGKDGENGKVMGFDVTADMMSMMNGFTVLRLVTLMGSMVEGKISKEMLLDLNAQLNKIKKPKKK